MGSRHEPYSWTGKKVILSPFHQATLWWMFQPAGPSSSIGNRRDNVVESFTRGAASSVDLKINPIHRGVTFLPFLDRLALSACCRSRSRLRRRRQNVLKLTFPIPSPPSHG